MTSSIINIRGQISTMERSKPVKIRYTVNAFPPDPLGIPPETPFLSLSKNDEPLPLKYSQPEIGAEPEPIIEIVTTVNTANQEACATSEDTLQVLRNLAVTNVRNTLMIIHSARLSQIIRDIVEYYPR